jgi:DNA-binding transcriptional LysR family regulator
LLIAPSIYEHPPKGVSRDLYMQDSLSIFCGPGHALASQADSGPISGALLSASPWLNIGFTSPFEDIETDFLGHNGVVERRIELTTVGDSSVLLNVLMDGRHLCVLPRHTVSLMGYLFPLVELPVKVASGRRDLYLWTNSRDAGDQTIQTLIQTACELIPPSFRG